VKNGIIVQMHCPFPLGSDHEEVDCLHIDTLLRSVRSDQILACSLPGVVLTLSRTGIGIASNINKNKNPNRIFPVRSAMSPTTAGPRNDADLSVNEKREKKDDSCPCINESAVLVLLDVLIDSTYRRY
jgi:hypothetical protein